MSSLDDSLADAARSLRATPLLALFAADDTRAQRLSFTWESWYLDLAKERLTPAVLELLLGYADALGLPRWIEAFFAGERINVSEQRAALHFALRDLTSTPLRVGGVDVKAEMAATRTRMLALAEAIRAGKRLGCTNKPLGSVVHIGIGGSDLGPRLVCEALAGDPADESGVAVDFVSNVDPEDLTRALAARNPETTLFVVTSKTFTTQETLANARAARAWLACAAGERDLDRHFVAVTGNARAARAFGVAEADVLPLPDTIGGRYSLWSSVGLPIAVKLGARAFADLLAGAAAMDRHFRTATLPMNLPVLLGIIGYWNARWLRAPQRVVAPYAAALAKLPTYLQQLMLESNGKSVPHGEPVAGPTAAAVWGGVGTDSQHAFFQWLHQGTQEVPVEFIVPVRATHPIADQQTLLVANAIAQAQALLNGRNQTALRAELAPQGLSGAALDAGIAARVCPGNRASTTLLLPRLDAWNLGALLAFYEHRTFVEGVLFGINSFDQWGVELGKTLAQPLAAALADGTALPAATDSSTRALVAQARTLALRT